MRRLQVANIRFMDVMEAKDIAKLVKTAVRILINEVKAERAMVVLSVGQEGFTQPAAQFGFETADIWSDFTINLKVLKDVSRKPKTVFVLNAAEDRNFGSSQARACCIAVPLEDQGFIYCDHSQPGGLDHSAREAAQRLALEVSRRLAELRTLPAELPAAKEGKTTTPDTEQLRRSAHKVALTVLLMALTVMVTILLT